MVSEADKIAELETAPTTERLILGPNRPLTYFQKSLQKYWQDKHTKLYYDRHREVKEQIRHFRLDYQDSEYGKDLVLEDIEDKERKIVEKFIAKLDGKARLLNAVNYEETKMECATQFKQLSNQAKTFFYYKLWTELLFELYISHFQIAAKDNVSE